MMRLLKRLRYSLSARLLILFLLTAAAIVMILSGAIALTMSQQFRYSIRPHIVQYLDYARQDIGNPPNIERAQALAEHVPVRIYIRGPEVNWASSPVPLDLRDFHFFKRRKGHRHGDWLHLGEDDDQLLLKTQSGAHDIYLVVQNRDPKHDHDGIGLIAIGAILLVLYLAYRAIRWLFRPVQDIQNGVQLIGAGALDHRIPIRRTDELGDLTNSINAMAEDIEKMLDAKRQLLLAISHELRSPLTRARVSAALLDDSETSRNLDHDLREMETLLGELLEIERLNTRHSVLNKTAVSINALIDDVITEHFADQSITRHLAPDEPYVLLDAPRIKLLIKNLLANAIRHNRPEEGNVTLTVTITDQALTLEIKDHGEGIPAEHIEHLTEPFYRVDPARQRRTGGYGLGLYLCRMIAEAHGGQLDIRSQLDQGTQIRVRLPLG